VGTAFAVKQELRLMCGTKRYPVVMHPYKKMAKEELDLIFCNTHEVALDEI
ncbi:hypothetical protein BaRGS_00012404, partial [Batillaria attramentaria]